jgi:hypothetical protein
VDFEGSNADWGKPDSMSDEECMPVSAYNHYTEEGELLSVTTMWMPNKEDLEALNAGRGLMLQVHGVMVPVALFTFNEKGEINE